MTLKTFLRYFCLAFVFFVVPSFASAQQTVTCESNDGRRNYCGDYRNEQIDFQRQISNSPCEQGRSWGVDRRGLWVDRGCRAVFVIFKQGGPGPGEGWWHRDPGDPWPPSGGWHGGNWGRGGACFYRDRDFGGDYICLRRGDSRVYLGNLGNDISSIRVFGGARVTVFDGQNFAGDRAMTNRDVNDLRQWATGRGNHTWNNRISSLRVQ